jgi:hypothetical protein
VLWQRFWRRGWGLKRVFHEPAILEVVCRARLNRSLPEQQLKAGPDSVDTGHASVTGP